MPTHDLQQSERAAIDPSDRAPWIFNLPNTQANGTYCSIKSTVNDQTPITVNAQGTSNVEDPRDPGLATQSVNFAFRGVGSVTYTYNSALDKWLLYETAALLGAMIYEGDWNVATAYIKDDLVRHAGGIWICQINNTGVEPSGEETATTGNWLPLYYPGSGAVNSTVNQNIGPLLTFTTLTFDNEAFTPYGVTNDLLNNTYQFQFAGIWQEQVTLFFEHDEAQQSRRVQLRLWNVTDSVSLGSVTIGIGRNTDATSATLALLSRFDGANLNEVLRWELGPDTGTVADVVVTGLVINNIQVSV